MTVLRFNLLLREAGLDPAQVSLILHTTNLQPLRRWRAHVARDRGVTAERRRRDPARFRVSILELVAPTTPSQEVIAREGTWKARLHTFIHGLNRR